MKKTDFSFWFCLSFRCRMRWRWRKAPPCRTRRRTGYVDDVHEELTLPILSLSVNSRQWKGVSRRALWIRASVYNRWSTLLLTTVYTPVAWRRFWRSWICHPAAGNDWHQHWICSHTPNPCENYSIAGLGRYARHSVPGNIFLQRYIWKPGRLVGKHIRLQVIIAPTIFIRQPLIPTTSQPMSPYSGKT